MRKVVLFILPIIYCGYIVLGGLGYFYLERDTEIKPNEKKVQKTYERFLEQFSCTNDSCVVPEQDDIEAFAEEIIELYDNGLINKRGKAVTEVEKIWTFHKSVYFATTVVSTIGYGNIAPATLGGRLFTVAFAVLGIPLALVVYGNVGTRIDAVFARIVSKCVKDKDSRKSKILRAIANVIGGICFFLLLPPIGFMYSEGWNYLEGVYYAFITITTIGFGDFVAGFDSEQRVFYFWLVSAWIVFGLAWMSSLISNLHSIMTHKIEDTITRAQNGYGNDARGSKKNGHKGVNGFSQGVVDYPPNDDSCTVDRVARKKPEPDGVEFTAF